MNEIIKRQLNLVRIAKLPIYDDSTTEFVIPKTLELSSKSFDVGKYYILELADYIINPPEFFTLHVNWNNNIVPKYKYIKCVVTAIMGKMIKVDSIACNMNDLSDINYNWSGWLPIKSISVIKELSNE